MTDEDLLDSLTRHFMAGCASLSDSQMRHHRASGICPECAARALVASGVRVTVTSTTGGEHA